MRQGGRIFERLFGAKDCIDNVDTYILFLPDLYLVQIPLVSGFQARSIGTPIPIFSLSLSNYASRFTNLVSEQQTFLCKAYCYTHIPNRGAVQQSRHDDPISRYFPFV